MEKFNCLKLNKSVFFFILRLFDAHLISSSTLDGLVFTYFAPQENSIHFITKVKNFSNVKSFILHKIKIVSILFLPGIKKYIIVWKNLCRIVSDCSPHHLF